MSDASDHVTTDDLLHRIDDVQQTVNSELDALRDTVDALPDAEKVSNVDDVLNVGQRYDAVIEDDGSGTSKGDPLARIDGIATFITQNPNRDTLRVGDTVDVVISKTGSRHAKAVIPDTDD